MLFFVFIYTILPNTRLSFWRQIPGAAFTTFGWMIFSYVYSLYIDHVANFSYIYGSLTALILLMLWLYICMNIVLLGAVLNKLLTDSADEKKRLRKTNQTTPKEPASPQEAPVSDGKAPTSHKDSGS